MSWEKQWELRTRQLHAGYELLARNPIIGAGLNRQVDIDGKRSLRKALTLLWPDKFQPLFQRSLSNSADPSGFARKGARLYFRIHFWIRRTLRRMEREAYAARRAVFAAASSSSSSSGLLKRSLDDALTPLQRPNYKKTLSHRTPNRGTGGGGSYMEYGKTTLNWLPTANDFYP